MQGVFRVRCEPLFSPRETKPQRRKEWKGTQSFLSQSNTDHSCSFVFIRVIRGKKSP